MMDRLGTIVTVLHISLLSEKIYDLQSSKRLSLATGEAKRIVGCIELKKDFSMEKI